MVQRPLSAGTIGIIEIFKSLEPAHNRTNNARDSGHNLLERCFALRNIEQLRGAGLGNWRCFKPQICGLLMLIDTKPAPSQICLCGKEAEA